METIEIVVLSLCAFFLLVTLLIIILLAADQRRSNISRKKIINLSFLNTGFLDAKFINGKYILSYSDDSSNGFIVETNKLDNNVFRLKSIRISKEDPNNDSCYLDDEGEFSSLLKDDKIWFKHINNATRDKLVSLNGKMLTPNLRFIENKETHNNLIITSPTNKKELIEINLIDDNIINSEFAFYLRLSNKQILDDKIEIFHDSKDFTITSFEQTKCGILINGITKLDKLDHRITIKAATKALKYIYIN